MESTGTRAKIKKVFALFAVTTLVLATSSYAFGLLAGQNTIHTTGIVADLIFGVYSNSACTLNLTSINWGFCYPGGNNTEIAYVKNLGTLDTTLSILTTNWDPLAASSHLTLTSDYSGLALIPGEVVKLTFTLSVSSSINQITDFSLDIVITGQE